MTCRNWECGILVPASEDSNRHATWLPSMGEDATMLDLFRDTLPVPMAVPGDKYSSDAAAGETKRPWYFLED